MYQQFSGMIAEAAPDALIPVPIHRKRRRRRGYNQAELVARALSNADAQKIDFIYTLPA